jgi:hypothetical protein
MFDVANTFTYHAPKADQPARYEAIREQARVLAELILSTTPECREQSLAMTHLQETVMFANAAIAIHEA